jgi:hypothetical protein
MHDDDVRDGHCSGHEGVRGETNRTIRSEACNVGQESGGQEREEDAVRNSAYDLGDIDLRIRIASTTSGGPAISAKYMSFEVPPGGVGSSDEEEPY